MPIEFSIDTGILVCAIAGGAVTTIAWFAKRNLHRLESDLSRKADREHMDREVEAIRSDIKDARDARERDNERIERASAEKFTEFAVAMRERIATMERNVDAQIGSMREDVGQKLDLILKVISK